MEKNIQSLFTEEEWNILRKDNKELCDAIQDCPVHFDVTLDQKGEENE